MNVRGVLEMSHVQVVQGQVGTTDDRQPMTDVRRSAVGGRASAACRSA
ncbi:MAG: hypothetical protein N2559_12380 [Anaerolineae bacterium]|nr:hypothetical protein [Anaerolineae bacterium]